MGDLPARGDSELNGVWRRPWLRVSRPSGAQARRFGPPAMRSPRHARKPATGITAAAAADPATGLHPVKHQHDRHQDGRLGSAAQTPGKAPQGHHGRADGPEPQLRASRNGHPQVKYSRGTADLGAAWSVAGRRRAAGRQQLEGDTSEPPGRPASPTGERSEAEAARIRGCRSRSTAAGNRVYIGTGPGWPGCGAGQLAEGDRGAGARRPAQRDADARGGRGEPGSTAPRQGRLISSSPAQWTGLQRAMVCARAPLR